MGEQSTSLRSQRSEDDEIDSEEFFFGIRAGQPRKPRSNLSQTRARLQGQYSEGQLRAWFERVRKPRSGAESAKSKKKVKKNPMKQKMKTGKKMQTKMTKMVRMKKMAKKKKPVKTVSHGYFLSCDSDGLILDVRVMAEAEDSSKTALSSLADVRKNNSQIKTVVYDRACKVKWPKGVTGVVDLFHAREHTPACKANPYVKKDLWTLVSGVNTSIAEQTFATFRQHARVTNTLSNERNRLWVLWLCLVHNKKIRDGDTDHLIPTSIRFQGSGSSIPYYCTEAA